MNPRRIAVLLVKEFVHGSKSFIFVFALVIPVVLSLVVTLAFGALFSDKPTLGIADEGDSRLVVLAAGLDSLVLREYDSAQALREGVSAGAVDLGVVLPPGFDGRVVGGESASLTAFVWGESLLKHRALSGTALVHLVRELAGQEAPVEVVTTVLGDPEAASWEARLLPFLVLMGMVLGGSMIPATSLVEERQKRTLRALVVTPTSLGEVLAAKGLLGFLLSLAMGVVVLALNQAWGGQAALLLLVLVLGAGLAAAFGLLLGALTGDVNTLFAAFKSIGIVLYAPALVYLFPAIPQWIGQIFPTYYLIAPVVEISQQGATWADVAVEVAVLAGLIGLLLGILAFVTRRLAQKEF